MEPICSSAAATTSSATPTTTTPTNSSSSSHNNNNNNSLLLQQQRRGRKPDHDDISQEQVLRIYHDELAKMMSGGSPAFNPAAFNPALSGLSALTSNAAARNMASSLRDYNRYVLCVLDDVTNSKEEIKMNKNETSRVHQCRRRRLLFHAEAS